MTSLLTSMWNTIISKKWYIIGFLLLYIGIHGIEFYAASITIISDYMEYNPLAGRIESFADIIIQFLQLTGCGFIYCLISDKYHQEETSNNLVYNRTHKIIYTISFIITITGVLLLHHSITGDITHFDITSSTSGLQSIINPYLGNYGLLILCVVSILMTNSISKVFFNKKITLSFGLVVFYIIGIYLITTLQQIIIYYCTTILGEISSPMQEYGNIYNITYYLIKVGLEGVISLIIWIPIILLLVKYTKQENHIIDTEVYDFIPTNLVLPLVAINGGGVYGVKELIPVIGPFVLLASINVLYTSKKSTSYIILMVCCSILPIVGYYFMIGGGYLILLIHIVGVGIVGLKALFDVITSRKTKQHTEHN